MSLIEIEHKNIKLVKKLTLPTVWQESKNRVEIDWIGAVDNYGSKIVVHSRN